MTQRKTATKTRAKETPPRTPPQSVVKEVTERVQELQQAVAETQVVPADQPYAGMTYDQVIKVTKEGIDKAIEHLSPEGAAVVVDMTMQETLMLTRFCYGDRAAREMAFKFFETINPYVQLEDEEPQRTMGDIRQRFIEERWGLETNGD